MKTALSLKYVEDSRRGREVERIKDVLPTKVPTFSKINIKAFQDKALPP